MFRLGMLSRACAAAIALTALAAVSLSGCSSNAGQKELAALAQEREALRQDAAAQRIAAESAQADLDLYRQNLAAGARESAAKDQQIAALEAQLQSLQARHDRLDADYIQLLSREAPVPWSVLGTLRDLARSHPEVAGFDDERGALLLMNDRMFKPADAALTREASATLAHLAAGLNDASVAAMDVRVVVHADAKPLQDTAALGQIRRQGWQLSNRRAMEIGEALASAGVASDRLTVIGHGDRDPRASNLTAGGRSANRRVEIYLVPRGSDGSMPGTGTSVRLD